MIDKKKKYSAVVMGGSAGGIEAIGQILSALPKDFCLPVIAVLHMHPHSGNNSIVETFFANYKIPVREVDDKDSILPGFIYLAPPNYHVLVEADRTFTLSTEEKVNMSRPSIDVLFESAADVYGAGTIGILLSGASHDGAKGMLKIHLSGGLTVVQSPESAEASVMPNAAIAICPVDKVLPLPEIGPFVLQQAKN